MKTIFAILSLLVLASCSGGGGGTSSSVDPIYGEWFYEAPGSTSTRAYGIIGELKSDGTIQFANVYGYMSGKSIVVYTRKSIGTFERNGDAFKVKYNYETCSPVGSETLYITHSNGMLYVRNADQSLNIGFKKSEGTTTKYNTLAIEDKNCNILSKIEKINNRLPANTNSKSYFDRAILSAPSTK